MFFRLIIITFLFIINSICYSQNTGTIRVTTTPKNAIIRIDTTKLVNAEPKQLLPGNYKLKIWAPQRELYEKGIKIVSDSTVFINKQLAFNNEYLEHLRALKKYKTKRFTYRVLPTAVFLGLSVANIVNVNKLNKSVNDRYNRTIRFKENYDNSIHLEDIEAGRH